MLSERWNGALCCLLSARGWMVGGLFVLRLLIFTKEQWALVHRQQQIDKRRTGRGEEGEKQQIKSNVYCSVILLLSWLPVWIMYFSLASFHRSLSFSLFLPLSVPLQHVKVSDVYIHFSIFLQGWWSDCEMMLFDNVLTNGEKNRVGWGNHQGQGGNGSRVTLQLSISFVPLLSLSLSGSGIIDCRLVSSWVNLIDQESQFTLTLVAHSGLVLKCNLKQQHFLGVIHGLWNKP